MTERVDHPLHNRLARILERATGQPVELDTYGRPVTPTYAANAIGANAYLHVMSDRPEVQLAIFPADTLSQARAFYRRHNALAAVRGLRAQTRWHARPNFHFGSFQRGYCWTCNERDIDGYVALWVSRVARESAVRREDWDRYWAWLESERIACPSDRPEFDRNFVNSNRPSAVPRPGLKLSRRWPLQDAQARGDEAAFRQEVRQALDEVLAALGAPPWHSA